ncbi:MAG: response regulator [Candidatus Omnitrophica bacterium]|nr:response regulator [Candidatus Omnitrophota bacterium]
MNKHRLLIVDDEPNILSSLKRILEGETKEIIVAETAEKAWDLLKEQGGVEVVICDNRLPGILGLDFLSKVKRLYPDTVRILVTGYPDLNSAMDAINKVNIWRYILKPVDINDLKTLITQAFDYYHILRENRLLLQVARQQAEWLKILKEKYPEVVSQETKMKESFDYSLDEKRVSEIINEFEKKYYPKDKNE